jgi:HAD superfamily hydrolase (TIGR01459 family)
VIPIVGSIAPLAATTKAWFVDIWGVMHNGVAPFAEAVAACKRFRASGGIIVLVSNAPRPHGSVQAQLDRIGVAREAYDAIISSGDTSRGLIAALGGKPLYHLGPERDLALFEGLTATLVAPDAAQAIVCTGLFDDEADTAETYAGLLEACAKRALPMICANPDLNVDRGGRIIPCAGAVAAKYEQLGGHVSYAGKPHLPIYEAAFALTNEHAGHALPRHAILAIGDGVRTDIAGAARAGIRSVYIASSVNLNAPLTREALATLFPDASARPVAAMTELAWA